MAGRIARQAGLHNVSRIAERSRSILRLLFLSADPSTSLRDPWLFSNRTLRLRSGILGFLVIGPSDFAQGALAADVIRTAANRLCLSGRTRRGRFPASSNIIRRV